MYRLIALLLLLVPGALVHATAITDLLGFTAIHICFAMAPGTLREGPTKAELLANNFSFDFSRQPIPISGWLSDPDGDSGHGHEFLRVNIPQAQHLDYVSLVFGTVPNVTFEYADRITLASIAFAAGSSVNDLPDLLGPPDGRVVTLSGTLVFGFASSAPEPIPSVPEPSTLPLVTIGSLVLSLVAAKRKARPGSVIPS